MPAPLHLSEILNLGLSQHEIDFVDINFNGDIPLFLDPYFLGQRTDDWSVRASLTIRDFFKRFLDLIRSGKEPEAYQLFSHLGEPNETRLGLSKGRPQGRGVGKGDSEKIFQSLSNSKAVKTGIVEDLEDCRLFVEGIDKDKTSDMVTNIIRRHLLDYTKGQCRNFGIPLTNAPTGFMWIVRDHQWVSEYDECLIVNGQKILLVPKAVVSYSEAYTPSRYHQHFILNFLQDEHLRLGTVLVEQRKHKNGEVTKFVTKKRLKSEVAPLTKEFITEFTGQHPEVFEKFKSEALKKAKSVSNEELDGLQSSEIAQHLMKELVAIPTGDADASRYHKTSAAILELLFYPRLISPQMEVKIHEGRKRIDIAYDNAADEGFFQKLHRQYNTPSQFIFVECKNYSSDPKNPELDQLAGRFSPNRGKFGILMCRKIDGLDLFLKRCADTYKDQRGTIVPLTDQDLIAALKRLSEGYPLTLEDTLQERFRGIAMQ